MPEETHNWLINFQGRDTSATTSIDAILAKLEQLRTSVAQTNAALGQIGLTTGPVTMAGPAVAPTTIQEGAVPISPTQFAAMSSEARQQIMAMAPSLVDVTQATQTATTAQAAFSESLDETGKAAQRSGHWLGGYIQRYLIRYLVVWQGMVALRTGIRDWIQAHEDMALAIFRVQTAMQTTVDTAQSYVTTMGEAGMRTGVPTGVMVGGAIALGPTMAEQAARFGQMTQMGAGEAQQFFADIQRQTKITDEQLEMLMARMFLAWAKHGTVAMQHWREFTNEIPTGLDTMKQWEDAWGRFEKTGTHAANMVGAAWKEALSSLGEYQPIIDIQTTIAQFLYGRAAINPERMTQQELNQRVAEYEKTTGMPATQLGGRLFYPNFMAWVGEQKMREAQEALTTMGPPSQEQAIREGGMTAVSGLAGVMQRPEYERLATRVEALQAEWVERGLVGTWQEKSFWVTDKMGGDVEMLKAYAEVVAIATSEMNERQKSAVWNWPGGAPMIIMPEALGQVGATTQRPLSTTPSEPVTPKWSPHPIDWSNPWQMYQYGGTVPGPVGQPQAAIVHGGETITPAGQSAMGYLRLQSDIYMDGNRVAQSVSTRLGDQLMQAQRASFGSGGGLVSPY